MEDQLKHGDWFNQPAQRKCSKKITGKECDADTDEDEILFSKNFYLRDLYDNIKLH